MVEAGPCLAPDEPDENPPKAAPMRSDQPRWRTTRVAGRPVGMRGLLRLRRERGEGRWRRGRPGPYFGPPDRGPIRAARALRFIPTLRSISGAASGAALVAGLFAAVVDRLDDPVADDLGPSAQLGYVGFRAPCEHVEAGLVLRNEVDTDEVRSHTLPPEFRGGGSRTPRGPLKACLPAPRDVRLDQEGRAWFPCLVHASTLEQSTSRRNPGNPYSLRTPRARRCVNVRPDSSPS